MSKFAYNPETGKIIAKGGKICTTCCDKFTFTFSEKNCCCYLDPSPPAYSSSTNYDLFDCVSYGGLTWYSTIPNNNGNTPSYTAQFWLTYNHCNNPAWKSAYPFGGIGRSPKYYALSWKQTIYDTDKTETITIFAMLYHSQDCLWRGSASSTTKTRVGGSNPGTWICDGQPADCRIYLSNSGTIPAQIYVQNTSIPAQSSNCNLFNPFPQLSITSPICPISPCTLKGFNLSYDYHNHNPFFPPNTILYNVSFIPVDCNYALWSSSYSYKVGDCAAWDGSFWECCIDNIGQVPAGTKWCDGNYWRKIE